MITTETLINLSVVLGNMSPSIVGGVLRARDALDRVLMYLENTPVSELPRMWRDSRNRRSDVRYRATVSP